MDRLDKLQEIKGQINELFNYEKASDNDWYYMKKEHIDWLIEQAEKVDYWMKQHRKRLYELEDVYSKIQLIERQLQQAQSKAERYEEALQTIANVEFFGYSVIRRYKEIAKKALEGTG